MGRSAYENPRGGTICWGCKRARSRPYQRRADPRDKGYQKLCRGVYYWFCSIECRFQFEMRAVPEATDEDIIKGHVTLYMYPNNPRFRNSPEIVAEMRKRQAAAALGRAETKTETKDREFIERLHDLGEQWEKDRKEQ